MNWTIANMELDDNQAQIRGTDMNELLVEGGNFHINQLNRVQVQF